MKKILIFVFIVMNACSASKNTVEQKKKENSQEKIQIEVAVKEDVRFLIKNSSDKPVYLYQPSKLVIEKFADGKWKSLKILNCPCDAPCNAPEEKYLLEEGGSYTLHWNKKLSWCGKRGEGLIRETVTKPAEKGKYRVVLSLYKEGKAAKNIYKEFNLK